MVGPLSEDETSGCGFFIGLKLEKDLELIFLKFNIDLQGCLTGIGKDMH